jgi:dihydroorotate dehydrogenase (NAD+) catalytic subunit
VELKVTIGNRILPNPVGVASGTFGYGSEYEQLIDLGSIGAIFTKAVTLNPRPGNDIPRIVETPAGILNSIGLANVGVQAFCSEKMPFLKTLPCAVIANVAGSTEEEYCQVIEILEQDAELFGYEINISCPNVKCGALAFGTDPAMVESLTAQLRKLTTKPLIVKLTPNVTDIKPIALAAENGGADALSCINTLIGMSIDTRTCKPVLPAGTGGLSGPAVLPVGVALTWRVAQTVTIPVIGIGGISCGNDALQYLLAGASAVQVGTANFVDPRCCSEVLANIQDFMRQHGLGSVSEIGGLLKS